MIARHAGGRRVAAGCVCSGDRRREVVRVGRGKGGGCLNDAARRWSFLTCPPSSLLMKTPRGKAIVNLYFLTSE